MEVALAQVNPTIEDMLSQAKDQGSVVDEMVFLLLVNKAKLKEICLCLGFVLIGLVSALSHVSASEPTSSEGSDIPPLDSEMLPRLLTESGYVPPDTFKALVIEIEKNKKGEFVYHRFDYRGTSSDRDDWWPASTVKLYAAIAAMEKLRWHGFPPEAELTFGYEDEPETVVFKKLVERAITDSKNPEFDKLVEIVGFRRLNKHFLSEKNGFNKTVMLRSYSHRVLYEDTGHGSNRHSPKIIITHKKRKKVLKEQTGTGEYDCPDQGNCTTLGELAETMRRVMMHETLKKEERFALGKKEILVLRKALKGKHARGGVADGLREAFKGRKIEIYHKGGYADKWFSDNIFLHVKDTDERWILALANRPGRDSLNEAALHVAKLIASGELKKARQSQ